MWRLGRRRLGYRDMPPRCDQDAPAGPGLLPPAHLHGAHARRLQGPDGHRAHHLARRWHARPVPWPGAHAAGLHPYLGCLYEYLRIHQELPESAHGYVLAHLCVVSPPFLPTDISPLQTTHGLHAPWHRSLLVDARRLSQTPSGSSKLASCRRSASAPSRPTVRHGTTRAPSTHSAKCTPKRA